MARFRLAAAVLFIALINSAPGWAQQTQSDNSSNQTQSKQTPPQKTVTPQTPPEPQRRNEAQGIMAPRATGPESEINKFHFFGSVKVRFEDNNYFSSKKADGNYAYGGSILRFGVRRETSKEDFLLELAVPALYNLPTHSTGPSPQGALGQGASYFTSNHSQVASLFPKQFYEKFKHVGDPNSSLQVGRFEFIDGAENRVADGSLAYLKQNRIANRLLSPNPFSYVGRSFDGVHFTNQSSNHTFTFVGAMPTRGGYDLMGGDELNNIRVGYIADTVPKGGSNSKHVSDSRIFAIFYQDTRGSDVAKVDNRSASARQKDWDPLNIATIGGHDVRIFPLGSGRMDTLLWGAGQFGKWGQLNQAAYAFDAEVGYQPKDSHLKPWYRIGYYKGSGDGNGNNGVHGTFFPMLPSGRTYARFPFFATANLTDGFIEQVLRPTPKIVVRSDVRFLGLADKHDLYYTGSGAYDDSNFGFTGRTSSGSSSLATLYDTSVDYQLDKTTLFIAYAGFAHGGTILSSIYSNRDAFFAYLEVQKRF